jgi:hypothetical protein
MEVSGRFHAAVALPSSDQRPEIRNRGSSVPKSMSGHCKDEKNRRELNPCRQARSPSLYQLSYTRLLNMYIHTCAYLSHTTLYRHTISTEELVEWGLIEKPKYSEKSRLRANLFSSYPLRRDLELKPNRGGLIKQATNSLNYRC